MLWKCQRSSHRRPSVKFSRCIANSTRWSGLRHKTTKTFSRRYRISSSDKGISISATLLRLPSKSNSSVSTPRHAFLRASLPRLGLRDGWREALQALTVSGVPSYLFSSGYGDIISNALLLGGLAAPSSSQFSAQGEAMFSPSLPQNLRIVSNFFRIAPDGSVRAFSQPVLHEK